MATPSTLYGKIAVVMGRIRTLARDGVNTYDKYDYVTADAIAVNIGRELASVGVAFLPAVVDVQTSEYITAKGATNFRTIVQMLMTLADGETGETFTCAWFGEAIDRSDKSISKAIVSATKYFLLKTFLIAGGEDDADAHTPEVAAPQAAQKRQTAPRASTPTPPQKTQQRPPSKPTQHAEKEFKNGADDTPDPHKWLHSEIEKTFAPDDRDNARHWLVELYTSKNTPTSIRTSSADLSDDELIAVCESLRSHRAWFQRQWAEREDD